VPGCCLAAANTAPILAKRWLGDRWNVPLDGGLRFVDGKPLLGPSKTLRGLFGAIAASTLAAAVLALPLAARVLMGASAMLGDALSGFLKCRLGVPPSGRASGLDQVPESLRALVAVQPLLDLALPMVVAVTLAFFALEIPAARWWVRAGWRDRPC
jgi:CDP-2,3-bis-(O-geranylgeranyl)-sn-glycerol synthase